jgi:hypothetical protein
MMDQVQLAMLFLAFLMLNFTNIVQKVSVFFNFFAQGNRKADVYSRSPPKINTKCYLYLLLVENLASLPSVGEKFARGVARTVTPRYGTPEVQKFSMKPSKATQRYTEKIKKLTRFWPFR